MSFLIVLSILLAAHGWVPPPEHAPKPDWVLEVVPLAGVEVGTVYGEKMNGLQPAGLQLRLYRRFGEYHYLGFDTGIAGLSGNWLEDEWGSDTGTTVFSLVGYRFMLWGPYRSLSCFLDVTPVLSHARLEYIYGDKAGTLKEGYDLGGRLRVGVGLNLSSFRVGVDYSYTKTMSTSLHAAEVFFGWHY